MTLNALNTATAGLKATQAQIGLVSRNVANVGTAGYVKRTLTTISDGPGNSGVATGAIARVIDGAALRQLRSETAGSAYTATVSDVRSALDTLYGTPGGANSLDGTLNRFTSALQGLASDPTSAASRATVLDAATTLAARLNSTADGVQSLRTAMESQLSSDTTQASGLLASIAKLNVRIVGNTDSAAIADLQDQRDEAINGLSGLMDVQTVAQSDGSVTVMTTSGVSLVDRGNAASLTFDGRGTLSPDAAFSTDPADRGVGTIVATTPSGARIDLIASGAIRSGSIAAAIEMRDGVLPEAQRQLDDLAAGLSRAMTDTTVAGKAVTDGTASGFDLDLTGLSPGNAITLTVKDATGAQRNLILVPSYQDPAPTVSAAQTDDASARVVSFTIPNPASKDPAAVRAAIGTALGSGYGVSAAPGGASGAVRITTNGGAGDPTILAASAGVTQVASPADTRSGKPQLALFVDGADASLYTGSFDGGSQLTGFAQRIAVNATVRNNTTTLVALSASSASSDATRPGFLLDALTTGTRTFSSSSGLGGVSAPISGTVVGFAQNIIAAQGQAAASAKSLDSGQSVALSTAQGRFASQSGVSVDEEMSNLISLQTAYNANARVLTAARDMLDTLLRI